MQKPPYIVGSTVSVSRTISESDVYLFGGITGDLGPNHINEEYSKVNTPHGRRVVHGVYLLGLASAASTLIGDQYDKGAWRGTSYGYDKVRFIKPVFIGDTVTIKYTVRELDESNMKTYAEVTGTNQHDEICFAAVHINIGLKPLSRAGR